MLHLRVIPRAASGHNLERRRLLSKRGLDLPADWRGFPSSFRALLRNREDTLRAGARQTFEPDPTALRQNKPGEIFSSRRRAATRPERSSACNASLVATRPPVRSSAQW